MPVFVFFDRRTDAGLDPDELGSEFETLDAAYLDACTAVLAIAHERLRERSDPNVWSFEIRDASRQLLLELPFREELRHRRGWPRGSTTPRRHGSRWEGGGPGA